MSSEKYIELDVHQATISVAVLKPHVTEVLVCNPRKIPLLKQGQQK